MLLFDEVGGEDGVERAVEAGGEVVVVRHGVERDYADARVLLVLLLGVRELLLLLSQSLLFSHYSSYHITQHSSLLSHHKTLITHHLTHHCFHTTPHSSKHTTHILLGGGVGQERHHLWVRANDLKQERPAQEQHRGAAHGVQRELHRRGVHHVAEAEGGAAVVVL